MVAQIGAAHTLEDNLAILSWQIWLEEARGPRETEHKRGALIGGNSTWALVMCK